jgi:radical SAM protein with 4Fe4S-binding SPASM domain
MNPDAFAMMRYARSKGIRVMFSKNAATLDAAMADVILDSGLDLIIFSVNGATAEAYAAVHGAAVYEKVVANIHRFLMRKRERRSAILVAVQMVLLPETSSHAGAFYRQWRRVPGVDLVRVKKDVVCNKAVWQTETGRRPRRRNPCPRLWHGPVYIETNGDVYASPGIMYNAGPVGNIRESRLAEVWNAGPMQALRRAHALGKETAFPACLRCAYPRPRLPLIVGGFLLDPFSVGKLVPWAERLAFWHRLPLFEKHGPDQFKP